MKTVVKIFKYGLRDNIMLVTKIFHQQNKLLLLLLAEGKQIYAHLTGSLG